jgi:RimJ/RimL family protein N-acetyltransferase
VTEPAEGRTLPPRRLSSDPLVRVPSSRFPERKPMEGRYARIEPLDPARHCHDLFAAAEAGQLWDYMAYGPWETEDAFLGHLRSQAALADPIFFAIRDLTQPTFGGIATIMEIRPTSGVVEIGHIWFGLALQQTRASTEALYLMMRHLLGDLQYRRLEWKCNALNQASRNAALRLGFEFEGVFYQQQVQKGHNRDTAWFSILDYEWPMIEENFERWLDPSNFDEQGNQKVSLGDLNRALRDR